MYKEVLVIIMALFHVLIIKSIMHHPETCKDLIMFIDANPINIDRDLSIYTISNYANTYMGFKKTMIFPCPHTYSDNH